MDKTLGIYVTSDRNLDPLIKVCQAANKKGVTVKVFFTHLGTLLTTDPRITKIKELADIALCKVGFEDHQLDPKEAKVDEKGFSSQTWHADMIYDCDRYITF